MHDLFPSRPAAIHRVRALLLAAAIYLLAWSVVPRLLTPGFPLDVVESLTWGHELQWGYYKHPPLAPWALYGFYRLFGHAGPYVLSQVCIALTLWGVWCTGRRLLCPERALMGTALTMATIFYTRPALEFNHNVAQMPLWAGIAWALLAALQEGRLRYWIALGLLAGLGMLTKYSVAVLLGCLGLYVLLSPQRRVLARPGPWLAVALALLVLAPHLVWLQHTGWLPLAYAGSRTGAAASHPRSEALGFVGVQLLNHVPLLLISAVALWPLWRRRRRAGAADEGAPAWRLHTDWPAYLLVIALAPGCLTALLGLSGIVRVRDMWGVPMWAFSGMLVAAWLPSGWLRPAWPRLWRGLLVWLVFVSLLSWSYLAFVAQWRGRTVRTDWPMAAVARQMQAGWSAVSRCPLGVVAGQYHLAGALAVEARPQASVLIDGDPRFSPWVTPQRLRDGGALWVWQGDAAPTPSPLIAALAHTPGVQAQDGTWTIDWPREPAGKPFVVHWRALVPAACAVAH